MAAKTLYEILELSSAASPEAIRASYERLSAKFDPDGKESATNPGARVQHDAVKEAFLTLGNSLKRKQYDASLAARTNAAIQYVEVIEPFWTLPKLIVLALTVVIGGGYYYQHSRQQAKLAVEKAVAVAKAKEAEERAKADQEQARLELQRQAQERFAEERQRREQDHAMRQFSTEQKARFRDDQIAADRERREQAAANLRERREEAQATAAARQQAAREKAELCRLERERYGRALSC